MPDASLCKSTKTRISELKLAAELPGPHQVLRSRTASSIKQLTLSGEFRKLP